MTSSNSNKPFFFSFLWFLIFTIFSGVSWGLNPLQFEEGLKHYSEKKYPEAEKIWKQALSESPSDPSVIFNLGLLYSQQNRWGLAMAHFREAQLLSPRHPGLSEAMDYILQTSKIRGLQEDSNLLGLFEKHLGRIILLPEVLSLHLFISVLLLFLLGSLFRSRRRAQLKLTPPPHPTKRHYWMVALWSLLSVFLALKITTTIHQKGTIIRQEMAFIRSGPFNEAPQITTIPEGAQVNVTDYYQDWMQVQFKDQPTGWVHRKDLILITTEGFR